MGLEGMAARFPREVPPGIQTAGGMMDLGDGNGPQAFSGVAYILFGLSKNFGPLSEEQSLNVLMDMQTFARLPSETTDTLLSRWLVVEHRAATVGGMVVPP